MDCKACFICHSGGRGKKIFAPSSMQDGCWMLSVRRIGCLLIRLPTSSKLGRLQPNRLQNTSQPVTGLVKAPSPDHSIPSTCIWKDTLTILWRGEIAMIFSARRSASYGFHRAKLSSTSPSAFHHSSLNNGTDALSFTSEDVRDDAL